MLSTREFTSIFARLRNLSIDSKPFGSKRHAPRDHFLCPIIMKKEKIFTQQWIVRDFPNVLRVYQNGSAFRGMPFWYPPRKGVFDETSQLWCLVLYPNGVNYEFDDCTSIHLEAFTTDRSLWQHNVTFWVTISKRRKSLKGYLSKTLIEIMETERMEQIFDETQPIHGWNNACTLQSILEDEPDFTSFDLYLEVHFYGAHYGAIKRSSMNQMFTDFVNNSLYHDLTIILPNRIQLFAHRIVLAHSEDIAHRLFGEVWKYQNYINISNINADDLKVFLYWMYNKSLPLLSFDALLSAMKYAEYFDLDNIIDAIALEITILMDSSNWHICFLFASHHELWSLFDIAKRYGARKWKDIVGSPGAKALFASGDQYAIDAFINAI